MMSPPPLLIPETQISALCRKWKVRELSLFGSAARGELRTDSDVDVLVTFATEAQWNLWDLGEFAEELGNLFNRRVDLVEERSLVNPFRRRAILRDKRVVYAT